MRLSEESGRLRMPGGYDKFCFRESRLQLGRKRVYDRVFRAEMIAVNQIDAKLARKQKHAVFDIGCQISIASAAIGVDQIPAARTAQNRNFVNRSSGIIVAQTVCLQLIFAV